MSRILLPLHRAAAALLLAAACALPVGAQLAVDRSELHIQPGAAEGRVGVLTVTNTGPRAVQAVVKIEDWDRSETGSNRWHRVGTVPQSCSALMTVFPLALSLDPGASQSVRLIFADSAAAMSRECWSAVMVESVQAPTQQGGVSYVIRSAVKVYAAPAGLAASGEVTAMRVVPDAGHADSLEVWFHNDGARHYIATGTVEFRRADNSVAASLTLPEYYILPGAQQRARVAMPDLPPGEYVVLSMVDFGGAELAAMQIEHVVRATRASGPGR